MLQLVFAWDFANWKCSLSNIFTSKDSENCLVLSHLYVNSFKEACDLDFQVAPFLEIKVFTAQTTLVITACELK
jgi:hypothetical protein